MSIHLIIILVLNEHIPDNTASFKGVYANILVLSCEYAIVNLCLWSKKL